MFHQQDSVDTPQALVSPGNSDLISPANTSFEEERIPSPRNRDGTARYQPPPSSAVAAESPFHPQHRQQLVVSHSGDSLVSASTSLELIFFLVGARIYYYQVLSYLDL